MARIRSIHPGLWTDEAFVSLSMEARLLFIGLWGECYDNGVFEWRPLSLKMRLFPADDVNVTGLLEELEASGAIKKFLIEGREHGAVRNFCRFQHPKKPNYKHQLPSELRNFVCLKEEEFGTGSEPGENQFGKSPPNGDGDGDGERKKEDNTGRRGKIVFESGVIRLTQPDFDQWKRAYSNLNLESELLSLTDWAGKQKQWFSAVSAALAKKDRAQRLEFERMKTEVAAKANAPPEPRYDPRL